MFSKEFTVVGISTFSKGDKNFKICHCIGDPFYDSHNGQFVCICFVDANSSIGIGDIVNVIRAGKNYYIV